MNNRTYDILKQIAQVWLPALGVLWFSISRIWGIGYGEEILATITAIDCFLGAVLGVSTMAYNKRIGGAEDGNIHE